MSWTIPGIVTTKGVLTGAPRLHLVRSLVSCDGIGQGIEPSNGQSVLEPPRKKHMKRREKNITADPESALAPETS